ncbi:fungal specific transcription factor factor domain-containing protein [Fusarium circinatum]|uniref:Fungal specific transcription factor factor domain-containing protein n=1 Tax=Fusarium circinatum TaxID=48490 RepID=A0A8H5UAG9_FUSCI|nr:fungal specific transcription factor factor domain-containing protein [Fusarium circinatum]
MENCTKDTEYQSVAQRQTTLVRRRGRGRLPKNRSVEEQTKFQPGTLQFINSAHPDEITNAKSIKLIRSHAAKLSRALQKEKKQDEDSLEGDDPENFQAETERSLVHLASNTRYRKIVPKAKVHEQTANRPSSPIQLIGGARSDAYTGFARPLSDDEHYLFDFYLNFVISYGYTACYVQDDERNFSYLMRHIWVPNAMSKLSLMAAVFHVACRNYVAATNNSLSSKFAVKKLQYRLMCIQMAKDAIESEVIATDTSIALAMLMASEAFLEGDMSAYWSHGAGVMKMVRARGGVDMLGMSGFLTRTVSDSIYLTQTNMISGPDVSDPKTVAS